MKIQITMASGGRYKFTNETYKSLEEWLKDNFKDGGSWFMINKGVPFILNIDLIEKIEIISEEEKQ